MAKRFLFKYYLWIAIIVTIFAIEVILKYDPTKRGSLIATTVGTAVTFCFLVQKQKLDELELFNDLFTTFNKRYNDMNGELEEIRVGKEKGDAELNKALVNYFNLCAEEYLFFREGYIHLEVWQSWCRGMLHYLQTDRIRSAWDKEVISASYYGLTLPAIEKGAARHRARK